MSTSSASVSPRDTRPGRLLVLDDEAEIRGMLQRFLTAQGFEVRAVCDAAQLESSLERHSFDLLVLDVMMPGEDGLSICQRLRAQGHTIPILMLTARGDPVDRIVGLEMGADDYLAKPFVPSELAARIRAMLRRQRFLLHERTLRGELLAETDTGALRFGTFRLDLRREELFRDGERVPLGFAELRLLCALASTPNRPVSRLNLIERARGRGYEANSRSVDVQVLRLRQLIEDDASAPRHIRTVWGIGYMLIAEIET
ncbi:DNA-binding response regulator [Paraburkholderia acidicola]|uniref:DNA-binding response regulator n=1 Tax=Paraburkholderia acidicola TaxID=1912599 RepID=A0A2A4EQ11_9BURK|nr:response regulator [Paraburkholderia acidicola]PCE22199.1 DNA-binding response regulator [Paraburkholderia acidicola]